jgi:hypothetical protein
MLFPLQEMLRNAWRLRGALRTLLPVLEANLAIASAKEKSEVVIENHE